MIHDNFDPQDFFLSKGKPCRDGVYVVYYTVEGRSDMDILMYTHQENLFVNKSGWILSDIKIRGHIGPIPQKL